MTTPRRAPVPIQSEPPGLTGLRLMHQRWEDVAFLHWRVAPETVAPLMPPDTKPDVFDGTSWVGLIPFRMVGAGLLSGPSIPWLGTFAETNVRLYSVDTQGRRGVVFLSLDASRLAVVLGARITLGLPYCWARMQVRRSGSDVVYSSERRWPGRRGHRAHVVVRPGESVVRDDPLADFLTARWALHTRWAGRSLYLRNRHERWPLVRATLQNLDEDLVDASGLPGVADRPPDSVLWSPGVRTVFGLPAGGEPARTPDT